MEAQLERERGGGGGWWRGRGERGMTMGMLTDTTINNHPLNPANTNDNCFTKIFLNVHVAICVCLYGLWLGRVPYLSLLSVF